MLVPIFVELREYVADLREQGCIAPISIIEIYKEMTNEDAFFLAF
jgi:hypothetical protein